MARRQRFQLLISTRGLELIDRYRGTWSRGEYVRQCIALAAKQGLRGPQPGQSSTQL